MIFPHAGLLELSQQYTEWALKRKVEHLIKKGLSADNVADLYGVATKFNAKVHIILFTVLGASDWNGGMDYRMGNGISILHVGRYSSALPRLSSI